MNPYRSPKVGDVQRGKQSLDSTCRLIAVGATITFFAVVVLLVTAITQIVANAGTSKEYLPLSYVLVMYALYAIPSLTCIATMSTTSQKQKRPWFIAIGALAGMIPLFGSLFGLFSPVCIYLLIQLWRTRIGENISRTSE